MSEPGYPLHGFEVPPTAPPSLGPPGTVRYAALLAFIAAGLIAAAVPYNLAMTLAAELGEPRPDYNVPITIMLTFMGFAAASGLLAIGFVVAGRSLRRRGRRHLKPFRRPAHRPAVINNTPGQPQTTQLRQRSITVRHEDLQ